MIYLLWTLAGFAPAVRLVFRHDLPLTKWLDRMPAPRLPRRAPKTPPRAHGGTGEPCTAVRRAVETGARRTFLQWLIRPRGCHAADADPLRLEWDDLRGRYRHAETGPMAIPAGYGADLRAAKKLVRP